MTNDLISRQAAIDALIAEYKEKAESYWDNGLNMYDVESTLMALPPIDPSKHGKWIPRIATGNIALIECREVDE